MCRSFVAAVVVILTMTEVSAQDFSAVQIQAADVTENISVLYGAGGNIGVLAGGDGPLLVDAQFAPLTEKILAAVSEIAEGDVRYIINTHWHFDHTGGNENFARLGTVIIGHDNVRVRMSRDVEQPLFASSVGPSPVIARPAITYADQTTLHWNGETIHIFHVPNAHTDTDSIVHFQNSNVIHMGDTLWTSGFPRIDSQFGGGSIQGVISAVESALSLGNEQTQFIPGHGELPVRGTSFLVEYLAMLKDIAQRVSDMVDAGMSQEAIVAAQPTLEYDEQWGQSYISPEHFARIAYYSFAD